MIKREIYLEKIRHLFDTDLIKVIIGLRRSGKTYLLKSIIDELQQMVLKQKILFISLLKL